MQKKERLGRFVRGASHTVILFVLYASKAQMQLLQREEIHEADILPTLLFHSQYTKAVKQAARQA